MKYDKEILDAVKSYYQFDDDSYLYLSVKDIEFERMAKEDSKYEVLNKFSYEQKWSKASFRKRQRFITEAILQIYNNDLKTESNLIYNPKKIKVITITSINKLLSQMKGLVENNDPIFFRGQSNFKWKIKASIYRNYNLLKEEKTLIDEMIQNHPEEFDYKNTFEILSKLQHYELPTRLIDITTNPLIALYFACQDNEREDGQFFVFKPQKEKIKYCESDNVAILSNLAKMNFEFGKTPLIKNEKSKKRFIHYIRREKPYFEDFMEENCLNNYFFVKAPYNNKRISKQSGAFIIVGCKDSKETHVDITETINDSEGKPIRYIIPFRKKKIILKELETLNINIANIFPEIDKVACYVKKKYSL